MPTVRQLQLSPLPFGVPLFRALVDVHGAHRAPELYRRILSRVGETPGEEIGHGGHGVVYGLPSGRVMKVTWDPVEIEAMTALKGLQHPNVVHVHDAFVVRADGSGGVGVVVRDRPDKVLKEFDPEISAFIEKASDVAYDAYERELRTTRNKAHSLRHAMAALMQHLFDEANRSGEWLLSDIGQGIADLGRVGVYGINFHGRNIGVDTSGDRPRAVIFDFGRVAAPKKSVSLVGRESVSWFELFRGDE